MSNPKWFRYEWIWKKTVASGFMHAKNRPLKTHENVLVFSAAATGHASLCTNRLPYFPQMRRGTPYKNTYKAKDRAWLQHCQHHADYSVENKGERYPISVLEIPNSNRDSLHPTAKPVPLLEYLIRTYTVAGETVLDNCMGSGSTGAACLNTGRNFIGFEQDLHYFAVAQKRLAACLLEKEGR